MLDLTFLGAIVIAFCAGLLVAYFFCKNIACSNSNQTPKKAADPLPPNREGPDASYFEKLLKYIPGELVAAYLALDGILREATLATPIWAYWIAFGALLVLTPLYVVFRPTHSEFADHSARFHAVAATVAFCVWVFALGGPFAMTWPEFYRPVFGSLLLIITTLALPVLEQVATKMSWFK